jgi:tetratricopeptide (TPR) repeat protein
MKKSLLRAAVFACLPFSAIGFTVVTTPATAAEKAPEAPKPSKSVAKQLSDAKKAYDAKDWQTVIAKCTEARAVPDLTDVDKYFISRFLGVAYFNTGNHPGAKAEFQALVKNPATPADDRKTLIVPAMELAAEANDNPGVIEMGKVAEQNGIQNADVLGSLAVAYYNTNDYADAATYAQKAVELAGTEGKMPAYGTYQVLAFAYDKQKKTADEIKAFEMMARDYGKKDDWKYLLDLSLDTLPSGNKSMREIAALDIYRLRAVTPADWTAPNYKEMADAAQVLRSWGDAKWALETAVSRGVLTQAQVGALLNQVKSDARKDEPALPAAEKLANNGKEAVNVAEGYYGYGRYADAARAAQKAMSFGGPTAGEAKLLLGMSQVRQGDEVTGGQTLASVTGDPAIVRAAQLWSLYVARKYEKAQPAAAANH